MDNTWRVIILARGPVASHCLFVEAGAEGGDVTKDKSVVSCVILMLVTGGRLSLHTPFAWRQ